MNPKELIMHHSREALTSEANIDFLGFSLEDVILNHRRYDAAMAAIAKIHYKKVKNKELNIHGGGLIIYGPSGVGKTTAVVNYAIHFPAYDEGRQTIIPVLKVTCPSTGSASGLVSAIYDTLGFRIPSRMELAEKTIDVCKLIKRYKVELILFDESHHSYYARSLSEFRLLIDTIKTIKNETRVAAVLVGIDKINEVISTNEQMGRRFSEKIEITTFKIEDEEDFREFRSVLKAYQEALFMPPEIPLHEANLARRFLIASNGNLDYLRHILEKSVEIAGFAELKQTNQAVYAAAFREYVWKGVPDKLNPFHDESPLRPLDKVGEPFYPWALKHAIGSPLARRNIIKPNGSQ